MTREEMEKLREAINKIIITAGKPLDFESIFRFLERDGVSLPAEKPKLYIRKVLYEKDWFEVGKGGLFAPKGAFPPELTKTTPTMPKAGIVRLPSVTSKRSEQEKVSSASSIFKPTQQPRESIPVLETPQKVEALSPYALLQTIQEAAEKASKTVAAEAHEAAKRAAKEAMEDVRKSVVHLTRETVSSALKEAMAQTIHTASSDACAAIVRETRLIADKIIQETTEKLKVIVDDIITKTLNTIEKQALVIIQAAEKRMQYAVEPASETEMPRLETTGSIRERIATAIAKAQRPLSFEEIYAALETDGYQMPPRNPQDVVRRVLENPELFTKDGNNRYIPLQFLRPGF